MEPCEAEFAYCAVPGASIADNWAVMKPLAPRMEYFTGMPQKSSYSCVPQQLRLWPSLGARTWILPWWSLRLRRRKCTGSTMTIETA